MDSSSTENGYIGKIGNYKTEVKKITEILTFYHTILAAYSRREVLFELFFNILSKFKTIRKLATRPENLKVF